MLTGALFGQVLQPFLVFVEVHVVRVVFLLELLPILRFLVVQEFDDLVNIFFLLVAAFGTVGLQCVGDARCKQTSYCYS